jgi:hypothetical protein
MGTECTLNKPLGPAIHSIVRASCHSLLCTYLDTTGNHVVLAAGTGNECATVAEPRKRPARLFANVAASGARRRLWISQVHRQNLVV